ncbi:hypothetical protein BC834DRAFT_652663 [Gloeopeniophorella convolvens]|nr:hypothetical protein BC834DRAFT_652663 [Gloeopeniophorella convolvens]
MPKVRANNVHAAMVDDEGRLLCWHGRLAMPCSSPSGQRFWSCHLSKYTKKGETHYDHCGFIKRHYWTYAPASKEPIYVDVPSPQPSPTLPTQPLEPQSLGVPTSSTGAMVGERKHRRSSEAGHEASNPRLASTSSLISPRGKVNRSSAGTSGPPSGWQRHLRLHARERDAERVAGSSPVASSSERVASARGPQTPPKKIRKIELNSMLASGGRHSAHHRNLNSPATSPSSGKGKERSKEDADIEAASPFASNWHQYREPSPSPTPPSSSLDPVYAEPSMSAEEIEARTMGLSALPAYAEVLEQQNEALLMSNEYKERYIEYLENKYVKCIRSYHSSQVCSFEVSLPGCESEYEKVAKLLPPRSRKSAHKVRT